MRRGIAEDVRFGKQNYGNSSSGSLVNSELVNPEGGGGIDIILRDL